MGYREVLPFCCLVMAQFIATISGQTCRTSNPENRAWIQASWRTIVDSSDYDDLLPSFWVSRDIDGDGETFTQLGGICTRILYTCPNSFSLDGNENNWAFSHYINYESAREVFYNLTTSFTTCQFIPGCQGYFTVNRYDTNSANEVARTTTSNYQLLTGSQSSSRFGSSSPQTESIIRPTGLNGFYLGFRDTGTCGNVERVIAYYLVCPARVNGLVTFPETAVPPRNSPNESYSGVCAPNSHSVTSLTVDITSSTSVCTERAPGGARCECDAGYWLATPTTCQACPPGEYRSINQSQTTCNNCPSFTDTTMVSASQCSCITGYFRSSQEGPEIDCTPPPRSVRNLRTVSTTANSVTVTWDIPVSTGRDDYYYYVGRSDPQGSATTVVPVSERLVDQGSTVTTTISNLLPSQRYVITVIARNGVSSLDSINEGSRTETVEAVTMASPPGPPVVTPLCSVVVWQPPVNPNGEITGYHVRYAGGAISGLIPSTTTYSVTTEAQQTGNVQVQVRAVNGAGPGTWSDMAQICQDACSLPFSVTSMSDSLVLTWQRPASVSGDTYTIQVQSNGTNLMPLTVTDSGSSLTYTIPSLTPFTSYVITLTNGQNQCTTTAVTLEGTPSTPRNFRQYCDVVTWNTPSDLQGDLKGYEVNIINGSQEETLFLGPETLSYPTTEDQRKAGADIMIRVRAVNGAGPGTWSDMAQICQDACSLPFSVTSMSDSLVLTWQRPASVSGDTYTIQVQTNGTNLMPLTVTDSGSSLTYTIPSLTPFTSYVITLTNGQNQCTTTAVTLEGTPSTPRNFRQYCDVVTWNTPSDLQGDLKGYEVNIINGSQEETLFLGPETLSYPTTEDQRKAGADIMIRVRAVNGAGPGTWSDMAQICQDACSLPFSVTSMSDSLVLTWQRPASVSGDTYTIQVQSNGTNLMPLTVTNSGSSLTYTIPSLTPFTSYVITLTNGQSQCTTTAVTLEGTPSTPRNFRQYCDVVTWNTPSDLQGDLKGYEVNIINGSLEKTMFLGPETLSYPTTEDQRKAGADIMIRVRAVNGAGPGTWSDMARICQDACSLPFSVTSMSDSLVLTWQRPASVSGDTYTIQVQSSTTGTILMSLAVTDSGSSLTDTITSLTPFTSYVITLTNGQNQCTTTAVTLDGTPSTPMNFRQYCDVVTWNTPSDLQGDLKGYEVNIKSDSQEETKFLGPETLSYPTTEDQRKVDAKTMIRVRANNTRNTGAWTSFYSIRCNNDAAGSKESSAGVLASTGAIDVVIIVVVTAAVCTAIFILIVVLVYVLHRCRSKGDHSAKHNTNNNYSNSSDVKLNNLY